TIKRVQYAPNPSCRPGYLRTMRPWVDWPMPPACYPRTAGPLQWPSCPPTPGAAPSHSRPRLALPARPSTRAPFRGRIPGRLPFPRAVPRWHLPSRPETSGRHPVPPALQF
ncbi:hypothetical protein B0H17DRAFT_1085443, partial [Mycena rosella]